LGHCKIVRDVAQISFGYVFAHGLTKRDARAAYREITLAVDATRFVAFKRSNLKAVGCYQL
jgi:hypothetical protein